MQVVFFCFEGEKGTNGRFLVLAGGFMFEGMSDDEEEFQSVSLAESDVLTSRFDPSSPFARLDVCTREVQPEPPTD